MAMTLQTTTRGLLSLAAVPTMLLAIAACGDDDDGASAFCDQARDVDEQMDDLDLTSADVEEIATTMAEIEPPDEIAADWATMVDGFERLAEIDMSDPSAFDEDDFSDAEAASDEVTTYLREECGIDTE